MLLKNSQTFGVLHLEAFKPEKVGTNLWCQHMAIYWEFHKRIY